MTRYAKRGELFIISMRENDMRIGLLNLEDKNILNEYQRTWCIHDRLPFLIGIGYFEEAMLYCKIGLELLSRSIKKRQSKSNLTIVPNNIEYIRLLLDCDFNECLSGKGNYTQQVQLFEIAYDEYIRFANNKSYRNAKTMRYICCTLACKIGKFDIAYDLISEFNKSFKLKVSSDFEFATHDTYLLEKTLSYLKNKDESQLPNLMQIFDSFFLNIDTIPHKTVHPHNTRPLLAFRDASYLFYKYLQNEILFDPLLVMQSPFYGRLQNRVIKTAQ